MSSVRPNTPAYWIFAPALFVSVCLGFYAVSGLASPGAYRNHDRWMAALSALVFLAAIAGPFCRALNRDLAAKICAAVILGSYWGMGAYLFVGMTRESIFALIFLWPYLLPSIFLAVPASISCAKRLDPGWTVGPVIVGGLCGMIAMGAVIAAEEADRNYQRPLDPVVLAPDIVSLAKCAQSFASSHVETGYPQSLVQLGPQGSGCLPESLLAQQSKGFAITYHPGVKDDAGKVTAYTITAIEVSPKGEDTSSISANQFGIVKYRFDGPHGKGSTNVYFPGKYGCEQVVQSLFQAAGSGPWRFSSGQSTTMDTVTARDEYVRRSLRAQETYLSAESRSVYTADRKFRFTGYDFEYVFTGTGVTGVAGFVMSARPHEYGVSGIRSFLFIDSYDDSGQRHRLHVYATPEDRPATQDDPPADRSEFQFRFDD